MSDKELLEMAAKAAGIEIVFDGNFVGVPEPRSADHYNGSKWLTKWNPLENDGDALRLATELELNVFHAAGACYAMPSEDNGEMEQKVSYRDAGGKHQATRQAIVRCAAEIAKP